jgi:hypothetical protein
MNPLVYIASSNLILPINAVDARCEEKDFLGSTCANSRAMILDFNRVQEMSSLVRGHAQGMCMTFAFLLYSVRRGVVCLGAVS